MHVCVCLGGNTTHWVTSHDPATLVVAYSAGLTPQLEELDPSKFDTLIDIRVATDRPLHCVLVWFGGGRGLGVDQTVCMALRTGSDGLKRFCGYPTLPILPDPPCGLP